MDRVFNACDQCFECLVKECSSASLRWQFYCTTVTYTIPYIIILKNNLSAMVERDLEILEKKGFLISQEAPNDPAWIVKLIGLDQSNNSVCVRYHTHSKKENIRRTP